MENNNLGTTPLGIMILDNQNVIKRVDQKLLEFFPILEDLSNLVGKGFEEMLLLVLEGGSIAGELAANNPRLWLEERMSKHLVFNAPFEVKLSDGRVLDVTQIPSQNGDVAIQWIDVTERSILRRQMKSVLESAGDGIVVWDQKYSFYDCNERFRRRFNLCDDLLRKGISSDVFFAAVLEKNILIIEGNKAEWLEKYKKNRILPATEIILEFNNDQYFIMKNRRSSDGGIISILTDISEIKRAERELILRGKSLEKAFNDLELSHVAVETQGADLVRLAEDLDFAKQDTREKCIELENIKNNLENIVENKTIALKEALRLSTLDNQAKSNFLSTMSHEFRTPLNAIIGFSDLLKIKLNDEKSTIFLTEISEAAHHLLKLVQNVLAISDFDEGKVNLLKTDCSLIDLLEACVTQYRKEINHKKINLINGYDITDIVINVDPDRFSQAIRNLVSNAIKFTPENGQIEISTLKSQQGFKINIIDNGVGMDKKELEMAIKLFGQVDMTINRQNSGIGLGLSLTNRIVNAHGGDLVIDSVKGVGTTATIYLQNVKTF